VPTVLFGLWVGAWVDRVARRPLLVWTDLGRAAVIGLVPLAFALDLLSMTLLAVVVFAVGALSTLFDVAAQAWLPSLVRRDALVVANSKLAGGSAAGEAGGFAASGWLAQWAGVTSLLVVDALTFLFSALLIQRIETVESAPTRRDLHPWRDVREGFAELRRVPELAAIARSEVLRGISGGVFLACYMLWVLRELGLGVAMIGTIVAMGSLGSLIGSALAPRLQRRFGLGPGMIAALGLAGVFSLLIPLAPDAALLGVLCLVGHQLLGDAFETSWMIHQLSARQLLPDADRLGRVNGSIHFAAAAATLLGSLACSALVEPLGVRTLLFAGSALFVAAALNLWLSPLRHLREVPD
jgi:MFS family permease